MSTPGSIGSRPISHSDHSGQAVERLVDEAVGLGVLLAADVTDRPGLERPQGPLHLGVQLAQGRVLDLVLALHLAHDQLGVADQLQLGRSERRRPLDAEQQRPVLGDVVGRRADPLAALLEHLAVGVWHDGCRSRPGPGCRGRRRRR